MSTTISPPGLVARHLELEEEVLSVVRAALGTGKVVAGTMVQDFERDFAQFSGASYCVGVARGTDALRLALMVSGVMPGDLVITVPNTSTATIEAISQAGAQPAFVDIDEDTSTMDHARLREYLETKCDIDSETGKLVDETSGRRVSAIVPVHLYGQPADMDPILEVAGRCNLAVVEDAHQAHGAQYFSRTENRWRKAGSMGKAAAFTFHANESLGTLGEAGVVTTQDGEMAKRVRKLRDRVQADEYDDPLETSEGGLDPIQAGILRIKLIYLSRWIEKHRELARTYNRLFEPVTDYIKVPSEPAWAKAIFHFYVIRTRFRRELGALLAESGVITGIHYPTPLHLHKAYKHLGYRKGDFPVAEQCALQILSLPMRPQLDYDEQRHVVQTVIEFVFSKLASSVWQSC